MSNRDGAIGRPAVWGAVKVAVRVLAWLLILAALFSLLARQHASTNHVLVLAATGFPYAALLAVLALLLLLVRRRWVEATVALLLALGLAAPLAKVAFTSPHPPAVPAHGTALMVMTFNMRLGKADAGAVVAQVRARKVQLLLLQEMTPGALARLLAAGLGGLLPHDYARAESNASGTAVFSDLPLADERDYPGFGNAVLSARMTLAGGPTVTVLSSHLGAPWPQDARTWRAESGRLGQLLAGTAGTVVDGGDFNANTSLEPFRALLSAGRMTDAAAASGEPGIRTYPSNVGILPPLIGIDHVLLRGVDAKSALTVRIPGSDHRAVVASLVVPRD